MSKKEDHLADGAADAFAGLLAHYREAYPAVWERLEVEEVRAGAGKHACGGRS